MVQLVKQHMSLEEADDDDDDENQQHTHPDMHEHDHGEHEVQDHQTLDNQVNQYFQDIKKYSTSKDEADKSKDMNMSVMEAEDEDTGSGDGDGDDDDDNDDNNGGGVDFIDLNINIDRAISESFANFNPEETEAETVNEHVNHGVHNDTNNLNHNANQANKKQCLLCGKTFQHSGSLGRHLDNQKGNDLHPVEEVDKLRSNVVRRGDPIAMRERRIQRSKEYNRRDYVKEKNRLRRKQTAQFSRIKEHYRMKFYRQIPHPALPLDPSFPRMVLFFLPPQDWPHHPPTEQTLAVLAARLESSDAHAKLPLLPGGTPLCREKLPLAFDQWAALSADARRELWTHELRAAAQDLLGSFTLLDFAVRDLWAKQLMLQRREETTESVNDYSSDFKDAHDLFDLATIDAEADLAAVAAAAAAAVKHDYVE